MPSIRETLQEMGVSVEHVLTELAQMKPADNNGTAPTPLTNYLDVRWFSFFFIVGLFIRNISETQ